MMQQVYMTSQRAMCFFAHLNDKDIIKNIAQKVLAKSSSGHRFHDFKYFEL